MTPSEFQAEKTAFGFQYVIPGTERIERSRQRAFKADWTLAGDQLVIPGAEKISTADYVARLAVKPMTPRRGQIGLRGTGLFGSQLK